MSQFQDSHYPHRSAFALAVLGIVSSLAAFPAAATPFFFSTGDPDGKIAMASRPSTGSFEIETADDFVLGQSTHITGASFTGLLAGGTSTSDINSVSVEIYRVFPKDSSVGATSGPPTFSTSQVPTRVNSPSDVAFDSRDSGAGGLNFSTLLLTNVFTSSNSVQPGGIHPKPNQTTVGDGPATGMEVQFDVSFVTPFDLPADHYFFVPQVELSNGDFLWLSAPKPIVAPGTPFPAGSTDLQAWTRDQFLDPDWLRVGTDIVGGSVGAPPTFNAVFSLSGTVPEPGTLALLGAGGLGLAGLKRRARRGQGMC